jgi:hypothetical protein
LEFQKVSGNSVNQLLSFPDDQKTCFEAERALILTLHRGWLAFLFARHRDWQAAQEEGRADAILGDDDFGVLTVSSQ